MMTFKLQVFYGAISCQGWIGLVDMICGLLELEGLVMDGGMANLDGGMADLDGGMADLDGGADMEGGMAEVEGGPDLEGGLADQVISDDHKKDLCYPQFSK
jgi:hypothetical protein